MTSSPKSRHARVTAPPSPTMYHWDCIARGGRIAAKVDVKGVVTPIANPNAFQLSDFDEGSTHLASARPLGVEPCP